MYINNVNLDKIGTIRCISSISLKTDSMLECNGSKVKKKDYPLLYAEIGDKFNFYIEPTKLSGFKLILKVIKGYYKYRIKGEKCNHIIKNNKCLACGYTQTITKLEDDEFYLPNLEELMKSKIGELNSKKKCRYAVYVIMAK